LFGGIQGIFYQCLPEIAAFEFHNFTHDAFVSGGNLGVKPICGETG